MRWLALHGPRDGVFPARQHSLKANAAVAASFAFQHFADFEDLRRALSRDPQGRASGPLAAALDIIANMEN